MLSYYGFRIMIDAGEDWTGRIPRPRPHAILITHAHPDHAWGLRGPIPCPVYLTSRSLDKLKEEGIDVMAHRIIRPGRSIKLGKIRVRVFPVVHSTRAPAVGYRLTSGRNTVFYVPDVVYIPDREKALRGARLYIGDGASLDKPLVRKPGKKLIGHTTVRTQCSWCAKEGVPKALFTHCGRDIVSSDKRAVDRRMREFSSEKGISARIACDGDEVIFR
jgi:phosphoribosyl 1,2-cyclic phosphodiesterase